MQLLYGPCLGCAGGGGSGVGASGDDDETQWTMGTRVLPASRASRAGLLRSYNRGRRKRMGRASGEHASSRASSYSSYGGDHLETAALPRPSSSSSSSSSSSLSLSREQSTWDNTIVEYSRHGDPHDTLVVSTSDRWHIDWLCFPADVVVKVEASTVSRMDCEIRRNVFLHGIELPYTPGCDLVGTIVAVGPDAARSDGLGDDDDDDDTYGMDRGWKVGDRVAAVDLHLGGNARYVAVNSGLLVRVPTYLKAEKVACLLRTYVAAYQCLHREGGTAVREGDRVLVAGGTGCMGEAVAQIALAAGARAVYVTSRRHTPTSASASASASSRDGMKESYLESIGVKELGRDPSEWLPSVEGSMDVVVDFVCEDNYNASRRALKSTGKLVCVGTLSCLMGSTFPNAIMGQSLHARMNIFKAKYLMKRTTFYDFFEQLAISPHNYERDLCVLFGMLRDGSIRPRVRKLVSLVDVPKAHADIESCHAGGGGAIVCVPAESRDVGNLDEEELSATRGRQSIGAARSRSRSRSRPKAKSTTQPGRRSREESEARQGSDDAELRDSGLTSSLEKRNVRDFGGGGALPPLESSRRGVRWASPTWSAGRGDDDANSPTARSKQRDSRPREGGASGSSKRRDRGLVVRESDDHGGILLVRNRSDGRNMLSPSRRRTGEDTAKSSTSSSDLRHCGDDPNGIIPDRIHHRRDGLQSPDRTTRSGGEIFTFPTASSRRRKETRQDFELERDDDDSSGVICVREQPRGNRMKSPMKIRARGGRALDSTAVARLSPHVKRDGKIRSSPTKWRIASPEGGGVRTVAKIGIHPNAVAWGATPSVTESRGTVVNPNIRKRVHARGKSK